MSIRFAEDDDLPAIVRLNDRLKEGGSEHHLLLDPRLPGEERYRPEGFPVFRRWMIAEDGGEIRAGLQLYHNKVYLRGEENDFCWSDSPISEGIVNRKYSLAIVQLMKEALSYQPFLMTLGVGDPEIEAFRFLVKLGWRHALIPFFFYPVKATRVLLGTNYIKRHRKLRYSALVAAYSGSGAVLSSLLTVRRRLARQVSTYDAIVEPAFGGWADEVFEASVKEYEVAIRSDATTLNIIYTPDNPGFTRIRVRRKKNQEDVGWIVVTQRQMRDNKYFGNLKVGTLADGFGSPKNVPALIAAGINYLADAGVDIIVANFSHAAWSRACRRLGMFSGPSSYYLFVSPKSSPLLEDSCPLANIHVSRGHSDGLWDLVDSFVIQNQERASFQKALVS